MKRWELIFGRAGGHRYFYDKSTPLPHRIALADASGRFPDLTDDGVLYLDPSRAILGPDENGSYFVPLLRGTGEFFSTVSGRDEVGELIARFDMELVDEVTLEEAAPYMLAALEAVLASGHLPPDGPVIKKVKTAISRAKGK
jgi:hypothetical protein